MPGHVKKAKEGEVDPDPMPYLIVPLETKRADAQIPYDAKKSYYCPDGKHGFMECMLESDEGGKATVMCGHEVINETIRFLLNGGVYKLKVKYIFDYRIDIQIKFLLTEKSLQIRGNWPSQPKKV